MENRKKILLTGATGYIGKRLLPILVAKGYHVVCCVRDLGRFSIDEAFREFITVIKIDLLDANTLTNIPKDIVGAYYLVHSMSSSIDYETLEMQCAVNFRTGLQKTNVEHVIYLSGIVNDENLSKHLSSRKNVEEELAKGSYNFTTLRAGIIIGSGSASFEIIRDIVEKLPVMITPKWLNTKCQPIGITDVLLFLSQSLFNEKTFNDSFDIGGSDVLSYKEMLIDFGKRRNLKRYIYTVPVMTPKLSSYWLYFVTSTSYKLATTLVDSMGVQIIGKPSNINSILNVNPLTYKQAVALAFEKIEQNSIISSWKDSMVSSGRLRNSLHKYINVPKYGCFKDYKEHTVQNPKKTIDKIWAIGGKNGWYYGTFLWRIRGYMDKLFGGIGLRRGRTNPTELHAGDALDFWRVIFADKEQQKLLLYAEMRLPGEAWLEFKIEEGLLKQTATFRPRGLWGRLYWFSVLPFHGLIFSGMINKLVDA